MMKVWLVIEYGGQYEDSYERIVHAYKHRSEAQKFLNEHKRNIAKAWEQSKKCSDCICLYEENPPEKPPCYERDKFGDCANMVQMFETIDAQGAYLKPLTVLTKKEGERGTETARGRTRAEVEGRTQGPARTYTPEH